MGRLQHVTIIIPPEASKAGGGGGGDMSKEVLLDLCKRIWSKEKIPEE